MSHVQSQKFEVPQQHECKEVLGCCNYMYNFFKQHP